MAKLDHLLDELRGESEAQSWEGTFQEYLNMVIENPRLACHSHARVHDMIQWHGTTPGLYDVPRYALFADTIFGLDRALDRMAQFFHAAATGAEVRRRILLLMGPPASGKSSIVTLLKQGLERYSRATEGATYAIKGCPMQEEPLHLIPDERRGRMAREYGLHIEGDLCPRCRHSLTHDYGGDISRVRVHRIHFSQSQGVGIGTFTATSPQHQDLSRLVGTVDIACFNDDRLEGAGRAFRLDGELEAANRGIMEFIEIFKSDERFLAVMLGVTQEQVIKLGSFGMVHADEVVIGHSNENEYDAFVANKQTEALLDRLILVRVPYTVQVSEEVKIYRKLLATSHPGGVHLAPLSLSVAAVLAVLSRLKPGRRGGALPRVSLLDKLRMYDGLTLPPYTAADVERLHAESSQEGMYGISPRYVINRLADAMARERECLGPLVVLDSLTEGVNERAGVSQEERDRLPGLLQEAIKEYKELALREVQRGMLEDFLAQATELFQSYIREIDRFDNPLDQQGDTPADERLLSKVEWAVNIKEGDRPRFRREVLRAYRGLVDRGETPSYNAILNVGRAIEEVLLPGRPQMRAALGIGIKGEESAQCREVVEGRLVQGFDYCPRCARDLVEFASTILQGKEAATVKRGRLVVR